MKKAAIGILLILVMFIASCGREEKDTVYIHGEAFVVNIIENTVLHNGITYDFTIEGSIVAVIFPDGTRYTNGVLFALPVSYENWFLAYNLIWSVREVIDLGDGQSIFRFAPFIFLGLIIALSIWDFLLPLINKERALNKPSRSRFKRSVTLIVSILLFITLIILW